MGAASRAAGHTPASGHAGALLRQPGGGGGMQPRQCAARGRCCRGAVRPPSPPGQPWRCAPMLMWLGVRKTSRNWTTCGCRNKLWLRISKATYLVTSLRSRSLMATSSPVPLCLQRGRRAGGRHRRPAHETAVPRRGAAGLPRTADGGARLAQRPCMRLALPVAIQIAEAGRVARGRWSSLGVDDLAKAARAQLLHELIALRRRVHGGAGPAACSALR